MYRLVQGNDKFKLSFPSRSPRLGSSDKPSLTIKDEKGNDIPALADIIRKTKQEMAKERRTMLRETLLMGVSRLVVEKGTIKASVKFTIKADEGTKTHQEAQEEVDKTDSRSDKSYSYWGWRSSSKRKTSKTTSQIGIATSDSDRSTDLSASLRGSVEIQFKSDYFKLDNFKEIFDLGNTNSLNACYAYSIDNKFPSCERTDDLSTQFRENFLESISQGIQIFK